MGPDKAPIARPWGESKALGFRTGQAQRASSRIHLTGSLGENLDELCRATQFFGAIGTVMVRVLLVAVVLVVVVLVSVT